jgi:hypothetical protein
VNCRPSTARPDGSNSAPLTADGLQRKVVLVTFYTYTGINWLRQLPHVRAWMPGTPPTGWWCSACTHPEFEFDRHADNISRAARETVQPGNYTGATDQWQ